MRLKLLKLVGFNVLMNLDSEKHLNTDLDGPTSESRVDGTDTLANEANTQIEVSKEYINALFST